MKEKQGLVLHDYFSGMGGFHLGLEQAGLNFDEVCFSDIDKHAIANYKYNFKDAKYIGGIESVRQEGLRRPNIITFGSPCQDFSLAGKRKGLEGDRSSLIEDALSAISYYRPDIFIWENVKGAFSSNSGRDFWAIIQAFANLGGYEIEWQLVNTSWLLPQNRERIYLIGHLATSFPNWNRIFPIEENDSLVDRADKPNKDGFQTKHCSTIGTGYGGRQTDTYIDTLDCACNQGVLQTNIRRLTEIECERLQGFPDNWTSLGDYDGVIKPIAKTQRYKLCGNAVTAKMVQVIGRRISQNLINQ